MLAQEDLEVEPSDTSLFAGSSRPTKSVQYDTGAALCCAKFCGATKGAGAHSALMRRHMQAVLEEGRTPIQSPSWSQT